MAPSITNTIIFFLTRGGANPGAAPRNSKGGLELIALFGQKINIGKGRREVFGGP